MALLGKLARITVRRIFGPDGDPAALRYEMIGRDEKHVGTVRLPVVGFSGPDPEEREHPRVLLLSGHDPYIIDFHPESSIENEETSPFEPN